MILSASHAHSDEMRPIVTEVAWTLCVCVCVRVTKQLLSLRTRVSQLSSIDEQSGSSAHNHSTTLVPGRAAAAPESATPELDSAHMNGLTDDKKRSVVPTAQSVCVVNIN